MECRQGLRQEPISGLWGLLQVRLQLCSQEVECGASGRGPGCLLLGNSRQKRFTSQLLGRTLVNLVMIGWWGGAMALEAAVERPALLRAVTLRLSMHSALRLKVSFC